jgi:hypothetical protein
MYSRFPLLKTCAPTPGIDTSGTTPASVVSSACAIGNTRTSEVELSLPHQSLDTSPIVLPTGCAVNTLRASDSSVTTLGAFGLE